MSVLLAVRNGERFLAPALRSVLGQTLRGLEVVVVDDGSTDGTADVLRSFADERLRVVRNEQAAGLAASLNRGLELTRARFVARLDADDLALPARLERQLALLQARPRLAICGSAVLEIDELGRPRELHRMPVTPAAVRWHALFGSPFYHPSVVVDRAVLDQHGLRYDEALAESEDYDLWARLLAVADGVNAREPLVLYRVHAAQASQARRELQRELQLRVALREIGRVAPDLGADGAELAWRVGAAEPLPSGRVPDAVDAYLLLLERFRAGRAGAELRPVLAAAARAVVRASLAAPPALRLRLLGRALRLRPGLPLDVAVSRARRRASAAVARRQAAEVVRASGAAAGSAQEPLRVVVVAPEPTPYRAPLFDLLAQRPELDLTVVYSARSLMWRTWNVAPRHRSVVLRGVRVPGAHRLLRHELVLTPGIVRVLGHARPQVVVVVGWSTSASLAALAWCRLRGVRYVLEVDSHDASRRAGWRRALKGAVVPPLVRGAASILVSGTLVRRSLEARGVEAARMRVFAVTVDVDEWAARADAAAARRAELRVPLGAGDDDVVVLSVGRLAPEKRLDVLVRAVAAAADPRLLLVLAGSGRERERLAGLARELGVRLVLSGDVPHDRLVDTYVAADVFALVSSWEPWGVVVNEAAACGLPLVLSDQVGAAPDLLRDGENGVLVPAGDVAATAAALRRLAADAELRRRFGERSRELVAAWGYGPSVESFVAAVREAARR
ncbi:MAG TPA: glycosyltransferase [Gaiellaceae bacterium]|nr:glycosyltransferase [Gaiellaceae bacterium]